MNSLRALETLTTKYLVNTVLIALALALTAIVIVLAFGFTDVGKLASFVDATFKAAAVVAGGLWALNRYFVRRTDVTQIRVEADVALVPGSEFVGGAQESALLIYHLDLLNTGTSLIPQYEIYVEVTALAPTDDGVQSQPLSRLPSTGVLPGRPMEPGSWSATNDAVVVPAVTKVVRIYLHLQLSKDDFWDWHRTFNVAQATPEETHTGRKVNDSPRGPV